MLADKNTMRKEKETSNPEAYKRSRKRMKKCQVRFHKKSIMALGSKVIIIFFFTLITTLLMMQQLLEITIVFKFVETPKPWEAHYLQIIIQ